MKKLKNHIILFLIPIVLIWIGLEVFYRITPNNYSYKQELIPQKYSHTKGLIFGDSHSFYGINPKWFSVPVFNMANISQTIYFDELLFKKHIDGFKNLQFVILPMEYTTLSQADDTQEDTWRKYFYSYHMNLDVPTINTFDPKKHSLALTRKLNHTVRTIKQYTNKGTLIGCDKNGWGNTYTTVVDSLEMLRLAEVISKKHDDKSMDFTKNIKRIKNIITYCGKKNITVFLVNMPVGIPYLEKLNRQEVLAIENLSKLLASNDTHVYNINLLRNNQFTLKDFHDADHLNKNGAKKCSIIINKFINDHKN